VHKVAVFFDRKFAKSISRKGGNSRRGAVIKTMINGMTFDGATKDPGCTPGGDNRGAVTSRPARMKAAD
jgi:hypothetical protein